MNGPVGAGDDSGAGAAARNAASGMDLNLLNELVSFQVMEYLYFHLVSRVAT